jgi:putative ABC transport system permease protein
VRGAARSALVRLSLKRDVRGAISSVFGVAVGVGALVFFVALGLGVSRVVREKVFPVDARLVEVAPSQLSMSGLLGGGRLDADALDRLKTLPGVKKLYRKMNVRVPAVTRYDGDFFGTRMRMGLEIIAVGVERELVLKDVQIGKFEDPVGDQPIPVVAASRLLEIYNKSFAPARGLPQLSPQILLGFEFPVELNRSFVTAAPPGPVTPARMQLAGVSDRGILAGVVIPLETAVRINKTNNQDAETYTGATLEAASPGDVPELAAAVRKMGFKVDDAERRMSENAGAAVALTTLSMGLLSALICLLAAVNIAHALSASVRARERELGIFRAVGATQGDVAQLVFGEALVLGAAGGAVGSLVASLAALGLDAVLARALPPFPFKPESFFELPPVLWLGGVALGIVAALAGAWLPARRAARIDPAKSLA